MRRTDTREASACNRGGARLLTERELEVLQAYAELGDPKQVARHLGLSRRTVEHVLDSVRRKLGVTTSVVAATTAMASGWIAGPPARGSGGDKHPPG